ncbi:MAG: hypothetical protein K1X86_02770 [Ignavibacteria bacterium]|nr:hypothetical protein [Ignavibacteria bacterium]
MNDREKYFARIIFKLKIYEMMGKTYEDFFTKIMIYKYPGFNKIDPKGRIGDGGNDGFMSEEGIYYQVYSPKEITDTTITKAKEKLVEDFNKLFANWNNKTKIKEFYYCINDKFNGIGKDVYEELNKLQKANPEIIFNIFLPKDLEKILFDLSEDQIMMVIGQVHVPDFTNEIIDNAALNDLITSLMNNNVPINPDKLIPTPDFSEKITLNSLDEKVQAFLIIGNSYANSVEDYFRYQNKDGKIILQNYFNSFYLELKNNITDNNLIFWKMYYHLLSLSSQNINHPIMAILAYYFEFCDIFEPPINK